MEINAKVPKWPITAVSQPAAYLPNAPPQLKEAVGVKKEALTLITNNPITR